MNADSMMIEEDEDGFRLRIHGSQLYVFRINDPEALYDQVKARIGPYLRERDEAHRSLPVAFMCNPDESGGYADDDPKNPRWPERAAAIWDNRDKTERKPW